MSFSLHDTGGQLRNNANTVSGQMLRRYRTASLGETVTSLSENWDCDRQQIT